MGNRAFGILLRERYALVMRNELEAHRARPPIVRRAVASLVLIGAAALAIYVVIGIIKAIVWTALVIVIVVAVLWALKTLVW
jgi:hypothetical protein